MVKKSMACICDKVKNKKSKTAFAVNMKFGSGRCKCSGKTSQINNITLVQRPKNEY
tara:strand:- start:315 stop:482 length:168 start_codon:yes stop_codon:yes gene_type:complete